MVWTALVNRWRRSRTGAQLWLVPILLAVPPGSFAVTTQTPTTAPTTETKQCATETCHVAVIGQKALHQPVAQRKCMDCHAYENVSQHRFKPSPVCTTCHSQMIPKLEETWSTHPPSLANCTACHDPHGSDLKNHLKLAEPDLCTSCHANVRDSLRTSPVVHGAMKQGQACSSCHDPHLSKLQKLEKKAQPQQCLDCHDRPLQAADGRSLTDMASLLKDNPQHHGPIRLGACSACHDPHASKEPMLLAAAYPPDFYAKFDQKLYRLCFTCHTPELALQPDASAPTGFKDGKKNLHWLHVNQDKGRTCRACHEVHASRQPFHIRDSVPFGPGGWSIKIKFTQTSTGGACRTDCHVERSYDHGDRPKAVAFSALLPKAQALVNPAPPKALPTTAPSGMAEKTYPVPPPPFTPGVYPCTGCHDPTRAANTARRVLQKPHADIKLQHDEEHRWCLDCHNAQNRDVLRSASGEPIPFGESYRLCGQCHGTQYRDWKAGVHGKRTGEWAGTKSYLLCVNCHDPHSPRFKPMAPLPPPVRAASGK